MTSLYDIIFNFYLNTMLASGRVQALSFSLSDTLTITARDWLSHTCTWITLGLLVFVAFRFVWWLVRLVARGFTLRK